MLLDFLTTDLSQKRAISSKPMVFWGYENKNLYDEIYFCYGTSQCVMSDKMRYQSKAVSEKKEVWNELQGAPDGLTIAHGGQPRINNLRQGPILVWDLAAHVVCRLEKSRNAGSRNERYALRNLII